MLMYLVALSFIIIEIKVDRITKIILCTSIWKEEIAWKLLIQLYLFYQ
jgi:hypothetical protein